MQPIGAGLQISNRSNVNLYPLDGNNIMTAASHVNFGTMSGDRSIQIGVLYPLQDITPSYLPGSRKTVEASVRASFFNNMFGISVNAYYAPSLLPPSENEENLDVMAMDDESFQGPDETKGPGTPADFGIGVSIDGSL